MLSRLDPRRCAVETVQYLNGTHPDFRNRSDGSQARPLAERLAGASPVGLEVRDGALQAVNPGTPERLAPGGAWPAGRGPARASGADDRRGRPQTAAR